MGDQPPDVSVIIPVLDDMDGLERCLAALDEQAYDGRIEVVVAANGPVEPVAGLVARHAHARVVVEPQRGSYAARNRALGSARAPVIAFTDADCIPCLTWIAAGVAAVQNVSVGLVAGRVEVFPLDASRPRGVELYDVVHAFPQQRYAECKHFGATANVFTRRDVIDVVGAFDASLLSGGDKEWGDRVHAAGFEVRYSEHACVRHPARATWGEHYRKLRRVFDGNRQLGRPDREVRGVVRFAPPIRGMAGSWRDDRLVGTIAKAKYAFALMFSRYLALWAGWRARRVDR